MPTRPATSTIPRLLAALCALLLVPTAAVAVEERSEPGTPDPGAPDGIHWSFEDDMEGWTVEPGSFLGPTRSCRSHLSINPLRVNNEGRCYLTTYETEGIFAEIQAQYGPALGEMTRGMMGLGFSPHWGTITSPRFELTHPTISMLVSGGGPGGQDTHVAVCVVDGDGCREVARVHGDDNETFTYKTVHLPEHLGEEVFLQVVDRALTGWSHIALDNVRANAPAMPRGFTARRTAEGARISWDAVDEPDVVGYDLYRKASTDESPWPSHWEEQHLAAFDKVNDAPLTSPTHLDTDAAPDRAYWYRVAAVEAGGRTSEANLAYLRPVLSPGLHEPGELREYRGEQLSGVVYPVGPIGYGGIQHLGDGTRNLVWILNVDSWVNSTTYGRRDAMIPHSFFAVRAQAEGEEPVVRALQTVPEGPFDPMGSLTFRVEEPVGTYAFTDADLPVRVTQHVESPNAAGDLRDAAIPTALYTMELENPTDRPVTVSLLASQQNAVGYDGQVDSGPIEGRNHSGYGRNRNAVETDDAGAHLHLTGCTEGPVLPVLLRCNGGLALSVLDPDASGTASWDTLDGLLSDFAADGRLDGPAEAESPERGVTVDGALTTTFELAPGETRSVPVVLSWFIPTSNEREHGGWGVNYANTWSSAREVHTEVLERLPELTARNREWQAALHDTNLPAYVVERLTSQISTMRSATVYSAQNGFLGGYEGHGCCMGMPSHVWQYAQLAPRLWPEIDQAWQSQWLKQQAPDGALPYRHAFPIFAFDGQTGVILGSYRAYQNTGDDAWLRRHWWRSARRWTTSSATTTSTATGS
jgi:non-lysosomal glucosylceramidase